MVLPHALSEHGREMRKHLLASLRRCIVRTERGNRASWRKFAALIGSLNFLRADTARLTLLTG
jgi:hypothetical protein